MLPSTAFQVSVGLFGLFEGLRLGKATILQSESAHSRLERGDSYSTMGSRSLKGPVPGTS
jgi:hypothetical protein